MEENAKFAAKARIKPLPVSYSFPMNFKLKNGFLNFKFCQDKYLLCDPLPDVEDERDLTSFITLWTEGKDPDLKSAIKQCQIAENVIKSMQDMSGEAMAMYDQQQLKWCRQYTDTLRDIEITKFDQICSSILDYMEVYTTLTAEEEAKKKE